MFHRGVEGLDIVPVGLHLHRLHKKYYRYPDKYKRL